MKAVYQSKYGSPGDLEIREVDIPDVGEDEVRVQVQAASLHPDVWHMVTGRPLALRLMGGGLFGPKHPIPGSDMAGVVESVGAKVTRFKPGDEVLGESTLEHQWTNGGAFAEYVSVREDWLAPKPGNVSFEQAASVPTSGFIALTNLRDNTRFQGGRKVLVNGAGGGVGSLALQIVKAHGAHVTAVDSGDKLDMLRSLGADELLDYRETDFTRTGARYDLIFDVIGNHKFSRCRRALLHDGGYVLIGHEGYGAAGSRLFGIMPYFFKLMVLSRFVKQLRGPRTALPTRAQAMAVLGELLAKGKIRPVIDSSYPFSEVHRAFRRLIDENPLGKVILVP
jgi:NADPH:quinone reductase-like Zn-dependent oxidoreductase